MNDDLAIKIQAFLDGELPEAEAREIGSLIASDADVAALHRELKNTRAALVGVERHIAVPESREFYWSKIAREIENIEAAKEQPAPKPISIFQLLRRTLIPVTGLALLTVALLVLKQPAQRRAASSMEVASVDSSAMTYRNYESGTTLVWLSFPAENGLAHSEAAGSID